ncbi:MAG: SDR family NAD(P)-dependent oxidoreductase, partial [Rudaea sp.]
VVLLGRKPRALEKVYDEIDAAHPGAAAIYPLDLSGATPGHYADLASTIAREYAHLDGIVFAAAQFDGLQPVAEIKPEAWLRTMQVNLTAPFLLIRACADLLQRAVPAQAAAGQPTDASVVFVIDDPARVGKAFWGGYGVSKYALAGLLSILHEEWESSRVRIHALLPSPMRSMLRRTAYFGENTLALPNADRAAQAAVYLLGDDGKGARGRILDLR